MSVIRWPLTFPPQPVNGRLLTGLGTPDVCGTLGRYRFFTTAPLHPDDKAPDRVTVLAWTGDAIRTKLPGPKVSKLTGAKTSTVPLRIERTDDPDAVRLFIAKAGGVVLQQGHWSDPVSVQFPGGVSRQCPAILRFYLAAARPELRLYAGPLEIDPANPAFPLTHSEGLASDLARDIGQYHTLGMPEDTQAVLHGRIPLEAFLDLCNQVTAEREAMFDRELERFHSGLLAFVFDTSDRIQHVFWAATDTAHPAHTPELKRRFGDVIHEHYRRMDAVLGKALDAEKNDTAIFVISDHGFTSFRRTAHVNTWLIRNGFMTLTPDSGGEGKPLLRSVDWSQTRAYTVGFCSLYLNLKGRERDGIVSQGADSRRVAQELADALRAWRDAKTGAAVVRNVYASEDIYQGDHLAEAPDLVVGFSPGYRASWHTALGAAPAGEAVTDNRESWSGEHLVDPPCVPGVFLSNVNTAVANPRLIDIAPTVLRCFNMPPPPDMDGKPLF